LLGLAQCGQVETQVAVGDAVERGLSRLGGQRMVDREDVLLFG